MDPVLTVAGTILATKAIEKTGETLTAEVLDAVLPTTKVWLANQTGVMKQQLGSLADRVFDRLPDAENPFHDPGLLAKIVVEEACKPDMAEVVATVQQVPLPAIRIQKGNVFNDDATMKVDSLTQNF